MDPTTDPTLRSWIPVAADDHFPIQNLPYGVFVDPLSEKNPHDGQGLCVGVAIGDYVLDVSRLEQAGLLFGPESNIFFNRLQSFLAAGPAVWHSVRQRISQLLREDEPALRDNATLRDRLLLLRSEVTMALPVQIGDYTDFYSSRYHATNVGTMLRGPENALNPNWLYLPVAYHGRASSIVVSGTDIRRPLGQTKADEAAAPTYGPSRSLDFELEMGFFVGPGNELGEPIPVDQAEKHIFGMVLVNDWSARDIQKWEYQPLGPFLAKNFATSISPWIVPLAALEPFRCAGPAQEPNPLSYLQTKGDWAYDIQLEVWLQGGKMDKPQRLSRSNFKHLYWNICQQLAHHTVNGCNMKPGDLLASGTISGPTPDSYGCLLELAWKGTKPIHFPNGERRTFLQDGDRVTMTGWCQGSGYRVGFGEVTGKVLPAHEPIG
jgi:fumarylacetoacetase